MRLIHIIFAVLLHFAIVAHASASDRMVQIETRNFLAALLSKNERVLTSYDSEQSFSDGTRLTQDVYDFLYRTSTSNTTSVLDIAKMGKITVKLIRQPDNSYIAVFYPIRFKR